MYPFLLKQTEEVSQLPRCGILMTTIEETPLLRYVQMLFHLRVVERGYFRPVHVCSTRGPGLEHNLAPVSADGVLPRTCRHRPSLSSTCSRNPISELILKSSSVSEPQFPESSTASV